MRSCELGFSVYMMECSLMNMVVNLLVNFSVSLCVACPSGDAMQLSQSLCRRTTV